MNGYNLHIFSLFVFRSLAVDGGKDFGLAAADPNTICGRPDFATVPIRDDPLLEGFEGLSTLGCAE